MIKLTQRAFRNYLNEKYAVNDHFGSPINAYGDYLYTQNHIKFLNKYQEWVEEEKAKKKVFK